MQTKPITENQVKNSRREAPNLDIGALEKFERNGDKLVAISRIDEARRERDELLSLIDELLNQGDFFLTSIEAKDEWSSDFEAWERRAREAIARIRDENSPIQQPVGIIPGSVKYGQLTDDGNGHLIAHDGSIVADIDYLSAEITHRGEEP